MENGKEHISLRARIGTVFHWQLTSTFCYRKLPTMALHLLSQLQVQTHTSCAFRSLCLTSLHLQLHKFTTEAPLVKLEWQLCPASPSTVVNSTVNSPPDGCAQQLSTSSPRLHVTPPLVTRAVQNAAPKLWSNLSVTVRAYSSLMCVGTGPPNNCTGGAGPPNNDVCMYVCQVIGRSNLNWGQTWVSNSAPPVTWASYTYVPGSF